MASTSQIFSDTFHEEIENPSVYNCVFCGTLLNGEALMLKCLHVACNDCWRKEKRDFGLQCKCLAITKDLIANYPFVPSGVSLTKICDTCKNSVANKKCVFCNKFYCKPCSKVHLTSDDGVAHNPDLVVCYPLKSDFILCPKCTKKSAEVFCTKCLVKICSLCHLSFHRDHSYKLLNELCEEIKINLSRELLKLNKNNQYMDYAINNILKETQKLEIQKNLILNEIDQTFQKLRDELNKRSLELKKLAENNVRETDKKIDDNRKIILDAQKRNKYYTTLVQTILKHDKVDDIVKLSKVVLEKLKEPNQAMFNSNEASRLKIDMKFISDETLENCLSAIEKVGSITSTPVLSLSEMSKYIIEMPNNSSENYINLQSANSNDNHIIRQEVISSSTNYNSESDSSEYEPLVDCSCCNQLTGVLKQCNSCNRHFHKKCHIPALPESMDSDPLLTPWKCTICQDISGFAKTLNQKDLSGEILVSKTELVIMERILMEIYCKNDDSEHFRELPNEQIYPKYYLKVSRPLSLNNIKNTLESNQSYTSLIQFIKDLKQVFSNGLLYYPATDPYYKSAANLQFHLDKLINRWIPKLRDDDRLR